MERIDFDLLFRWFARLRVDEPAWDHSRFSKKEAAHLETPARGRSAAKFLSSVSVHKAIDGHLSTTGKPPNGFKWRFRIAR